MCYIRLFSFYCLGLLIGGFSVVVFAQSTGSYTPQYFWSYPWTTNTGQFNSVADVCAYDIAQPGWAQASPGYTFTCANVNQPPNPVLGDYGTYQVKAQKDANVFYTGRTTWYHAKCLSGGDLVGNTCQVTCDAGLTWNPDLNQCQATCVAGSNKGYYSTGFQTTACINGCSYTRSASGNFSTCSGWSDATGWSSCYLAQSGATCSTPNGAPSSAQAQCPVGQCPGTINGVPVCVPCTGKTDTQSSGTKTTTNPDGSTTTTTTTTNSTSDGGSTTTTTTTNTTNTPAGGGAPTTTTTTDTETKPKDSFCIENPDSPLCKQSSFGGSCGSFSCDGDAIQCAMAKEQHKRNCVLFETETEQSTLGRDAAAGNDPLKSQFPTAEGQKQTIDLSSKLDQSGFLSGSCPAPLQTSFMGHQITLDWSNACMVVEWLGYLVVASAMVLAYLIIGG